MADSEQRLREIIEKIATEFQYEKYDVKIQPVSTGGANYTSRLYSVTVLAPDRANLRLFAKVAMMGEKIRSMSQTPMFEIETTVYTQILPKYKELEEKYGIPEEERLVFAKYYGGTTEYMKEILILEDMTHAGYRSFDRLKCFDWQYASACVTTLARLHALSVAFEKKYPEEYLQVTKILNFEFPVEQMKGFHAYYTDVAVKATEEQYKVKVEQFLRDQLVGNRLLKYYIPERTMLLQHGDFKPSNILQKTYEGGKLDLVFVDHQMVQRGNPVPDLLFFLIAGSDEEFRRDHLHQYFNHYYDELGKALGRFGIDCEDVYKKRHYEEDVKELLPFGLMLGAFFLPIITVDPEKAPRPEDGIDMDNLDLEVSDLFPVRFNGLVRDYVRLGIL